MQITDNTPRASRSIGATDGPVFLVSIPQPYAEGPHSLTAGEASALNQTVAENISNNLRKTLISGKTEGEGENVTNRPWTPEEAQAIVDDYLTEYEIGVRRRGESSARVVDPVEREARKIARDKAKALIRENGGKPSDYDLDPITDQIFEANRDLLMAEGAKIVKAAEKARAASDAVDLSGVSLSAAAT